MTRDQAKVLGIAMRLVECNATKADLVYYELVAAVKELRRNERTRHLRKLRPKAQS